MFGPFAIKYSAHFSPCSGCLCAHHLLIVVYPVFKTTPPPCGQTPTTNTTLTAFRNKGQ